MAEDLYLKRLRYFNHQFLRLEDFETEQDYHLRMRREHNRRFHQWGVADGLQVQVGSGDRRQVRVTPGVALDAKGQEIVLPVEVVKTVSGAAGDTVYVTIAFSQERASPTTESGPEEYRRWREVPEVELRAEAPSDPSMELVLAELVLDAGAAVGSVAPGGRRPVGAVSPELRALFLVPVDGDAQRVIAGAAVRPLEVMLANAAGPVTDPNVSVRFTALAGSGTLQGGVSEVTLPFTDASGIVGCAWTPDPNAADQTVTAVLVAPNGTGLGAPTELRFHAGAEAAQHVSYAPGSSTLLNGKTTVQSAVAALAEAAQTAATTIASQGATLTTQGTTLATHGTTLTTHAGTLKTLGDTVAAQGTTLGAHTTTLDTHAGTLTTHGTTLTTQGTTLASHTGTLATHTSEIATLNTTAGTLSATAKRMRLVPLSGDDQPIVPGGTLKAMKVLVADADGPVRNTAVKVRFQVSSGTGTLNGSATTTSHEVAVSATDGTATCSWAAADATAELEVTATLVAPTGTSTSAPTVVYFRATRATAERVSYAPGTSPTLAGKTTVQAAVAQLATAVEGAGASITGLTNDVTPLKSHAAAWRLRPTTADFFGIRPDSDEAITLGVQVSTASGGVANSAAYVRFRVTAGSGTVDYVTELNVQARAIDGMATVQWRPDKGALYQEVTAEIQEVGGRSYTWPKTIVFRGVLNARWAERPVIDLTGVEWMYGSQLRHDWGYTMSRFRYGFRFGLTEPAVHAYEKSVRLWVEIPYPLTNSELGDWSTYGNRRLGYRRVDLAMRGPGANPYDAVIHVQPSNDAADWLQNKVIPYVRNLGLSGTALRVGVTLKANHIWSQDGERYLRGGLLGTRGPDGNIELRWGLDQPRHDGDLEFWFYLQDYEGRPDLDEISQLVVEDEEPQPEYRYGQAYSYYPMYSKVYGWRTGYGYGYYDLFTGIGTRLL